MRIACAFRMECHYNFPIPLRSGVFGALDLHAHR